MKFIISKIILKFCRIIKVDRKIPDYIYLKLIYRVQMHEKLNLINPQTFNEKLQWLKLYDRKKVYTTMVDKYEVKEYVANIIGEKYIIPTLGIYNSFNEINFKELPNQFVIKCTHDSGGGVIVKDKSNLNIKLAKKKINKCLKKNYFYNGREWPYKNVKPKIIIEKLLEYDTNKELLDYKFFCFNGNVKVILVCSDRATNLKETFFNKDWKRLDLKRKNHEVDLRIQKPDNLKKMIELSERLAKNISFIRVDFYNINGKIYFGELTFYPASGLEKFEPEKWDVKLGEWIKLPADK